MHWDEQHTWNIIFSLLFLVFVLNAYLMLDARNINLYTLSLIDLVLLSLATFRLTRLFVYDHITEWVRDLFLDIREVDGALVRSTPAQGPRRTLATLMGCPWCFGIWAAFVVLVLYAISPLTHFIVTFLAIAGAGTFLQILANLVGWSAEYKKRTAESVPESTESAHR